MERKMILSTLAKASRASLALFISLAMILLLVPAVQHSEQTAQATEVTSGNGMEVNSDGDAVVTIAEKYSTYVMRGNSTPYDSSQRFSTTESVYQPYEIGMAGTIKKLAYNIISVDPLVTSNVKIYFATIDDMSTIGGSGVDASEFTLVYEGKPTIGQKEGWETLTLTNPYEYDGEGSLVIAVCKKSNSCSNNLFYEQSSVSNSVVAYYSQTVEDEASISEHSSSAMSTYETNYRRPNIQLTVTPTADPNPVISPEQESAIIGNSIDITVDVSKDIVGKAIDSKRVKITGYQWKYYYEGKGVTKEFDKIASTATSNKFKLTIPDDSYTGASYYVWCEVSYTLDGIAKTADTTDSRITCVTATPATVPTVTIAADGDAFVQQDYSSSVKIKVTCSPSKGSEGVGSYSYQWYTCDKDGSNAKAIEESAWKDEYEVVAKVAAGTYYYKCEVTNTFERVKTAKAMSPVIAVEIKPLEISTAQDLVEFSELIGKVSNWTYYKGSTVYLTNDIDMSSVENFAPIGASGSLGGNGCFQGTFDGQGHTIKNLTISASGRQYAGLFARLPEGSCVKNLKIENANVTSTYDSEYSYSQVGVLSGTAEDATISNVSVMSSTVAAASGAAGGLVGYIKEPYNHSEYPEDYDYVPMSEITASSFSGEVSVGETENGAWVGGLAGECEYGTISDSYSTGSVINESTNENVSTAGFTATTGEEAKINNCFTNAEVTGPGDALFCYVWYKNVKVFSAAKPCYYELYDEEDNATGDNYSPSSSQLIPKYYAELASADFVDLLNSKASGGADTFVAGTDGYPVLEFEASTLPVVKLSPSSYAPYVKAGTKLSITADASKDAFGNDAGMNIESYTWFKAVDSGESQALGTSPELFTLDIGEISADDIGKSLGYVCVVGYEKDGVSNTSKVGITIPVVSDAVPGTPSEVKVEPESATVFEGQRGPELSCTFMQPSSDFGEAKYQWYTCSKDGSNKEPVDGADNATYKPATQKTVGEVYYTCSVTNVLEKFKTSEEIFSNVICFTVVPTDISTGEELLALAEAVNSGDCTYEGITVTLKNDIDMSDIEMIPIGTADADFSYRDSSKTTTAFMGTFDGKGHVISNMTIENSESYYAGMFGAIWGATIKNFTLKDASISSTYEEDYYGMTNGGIVGGIVGFARYRNNDYSLIENVGFEGTVISDGYATDVGGFVGYAYGADVKSCYANAGVLLDACDNIYGYVGGFAGYSYVSKFLNCYANCDVTNDASYSGEGSCDIYTASFVGNLYNNSYNPIKNCYAIGSLSAVVEENAYGFAMTWEGEGSVGVFSASEPCYCLSGNGYEGAAVDTDSLDEGSIVALTADEFKSANLVKKLNAAAGKGTFIACPDCGAPLLAWQIPGANDVEPAPVVKDTRLDAGKTIKVGNLVYTVLKGKKTVSVKAYAKAKGKIKKLNVKSSIKDAKGNVYKVTQIAKKGFKGCKKLTKVSGGKQLVKIGASAFSGCKKLKNFTCTSKVLKTIGSKAFYKTSKLTKITIKKTIKLKTVTKAFKKAGKNGGKKLVVKVKSSKKKAYKKLILKKGKNKKLIVK